MFVFHSIAYRIVYALSNAGANPNIPNENGNTPLHEALMRDFTDIGLDFIQVKNNSISNLYLCIFQGVISYWN